MTTQFTVNAVTSRMVNTKFGAKPVYDLETTIGKVKYGWKDPRKAGIDSGTAIEATINQSKYGAEVVEGTVKVLTGGASPAASTPPPQSRTPSSGGGGYGAASRPFPVPKTSGEMAIIRQNALTNAVNAFQHYLGFSPDNTAAGDLDDYVNQIIEIAYKFAEFTSGQREVAAAEAIVQKSATNDELSSMIEAMRAKV